jgi:hypothetical protein
MPINWEAIKIDYIYGIFDEQSTPPTIIYPTLKMLAEKYHVAEITVRIRSSKEKWKMQREEIKSQMSAEEGQARITERRTLSAKYDVDTLNAIENIDKIIKRGYFQKLYGIYIDGEEDIDHLILNDEETLPDVNPKDLKYIMDIIVEKNKLVKDIFAREKEQKNESSTKQIQQSYIEEDPAKIKEGSLDYLDYIVKRNKEEESLEKNRVIRQVKEEEDLEKDED